MSLCKQKAALEVLLRSEKLFVSELADVALLLVKLVKISGRLGRKTCRCRDVVTQLYKLLVEYHVRKNAESVADARWRATEC